MRKKLILFLMLALLGSTSFLRADEVSYDFESGMQGWTTIDGDGDGYTWVLASATMGSGYGHNGSADLVLSMSYNNNVGALTPNNFLVSPAKGEYSQITFFACAQDNAWAAEHFGVAVSTAGNTSASDFTTIQEWTMTAKGNGGITAPGRGGNNRTQGNWYQYGVDLSAYAGQQIWVALRHFNCTDYFYLDVDDITLGGDGSVPTPPAPYMPSIVVGSLEGAGNNTYLPMNSLYNYSYSQQIYTAEEIGTGGVIDTLVMWMYGTADLPARTFDIYLKEVDKDAFANTTDWVTLAATDLVYSGTVAFNNTTAEPYKFILNTPFNYSGEHNLLVCFNNLTGTWKSGLNGKVFGANSDPVRAIYVRQDGAAYNPFDPTFTATSTTYQRNVLGICMEGSGPTPPTPPTPTGELSITPTEFTMGDRPINAWMEPFSFRILNGGPDTHIEGALSNVSGVNPFIMEPESIDMDFAYEDVLDGVITVNPDLATAGEYAEEFSLFFTEGDRSIIQIPVTANAYFAVAPDVVEFPGEITNPASFSETPTGVYANYLLPGMTQMLPDAVYHFNLPSDVVFHVTLSKPGVIAFYPVETGESLLLSSGVEPLQVAETSMEGILLAGDYFMIVAGENINTTTVSGYTEAIPAPTELTYVAPENMLVDVEAPVTLEWTGGDNATQYQVLFGTNYPPQVAMDWTMVDDNYGSFEIAELNPSTQYFWQIKVRNSEGQINGPVWGFTTTLVAPTNVSMNANEIFTDGSTLIKWANMGGGGGFSGELTVADGTATSSYIPVYGLWMDDFTRAEMIYPAEMLEEMYGGDITSLKYYISSAASGPWTGDVFNVYMMEVDATTMSSFYTAADAEIVYTGGLDGQGTEMVIELDNSYTYGGGNLLIGIEEITASTWKSCSFYGIEATGASGSGYSSASVAAVPFSQRNFLPKTTFTCGGKGYRDVTANRSFKGYNVYMVYGEDNGGGSTPPTPPTPGDSWSDDFEDGALTNWTVIDADGDGQNWVDATPASYGIGNAHSGTHCASSWSWNNVSYDPDNYMISPMFANASSIQYFVATNTGYPDHYALMASTTGSSASDFTTVFEETVGSAKDGYHGTKSSMTQAGTRDMSAWFERNVTLPSGTKYVAFRHYNSYDMNYLFVDDVTVNLGSKNRDDELTVIKLNDAMLTTNQYLFEPDPTFYNMPEGGNIHVTAVYDEGESGFDAGVNTLYISGYTTFTGTVTDLISGEPVAGASITFVGNDEFNNTVAYNNITTNASGEYTVAVKVGEYTGSASADGYEVTVLEGLTNQHLTPEVVNFVIHEIYYPVYRVYAEDMDNQMAKVQWSLYDFTPANPGGGGGGGGGGTGSTFTEDFEGGAIPAGWATIDADGDGSNWMMGSAAMGSGYGHNGSADLVLSKSYDNSIGALNPNNYLVTPQVTLGAGSTFRFFACAQDNAWAAEHFGVAISTGSQTNPSDFTMLQEWTMTAKGQGVPAPGRGGDLRTQGNWYEYTVDLSAYAGQQAYLAIRHFNCTDYFYLDVDDVALTNGSKGDRSVNHYTLYRKAILHEGAATEADSLMLADNLTDTLYADFDWFNVEPGLYQYGVSAVYPIPADKGNRGGAYIDFETGDFSQFDFTNGGTYPWAVVTPGYESNYCMKSTNGGVASSTSTISATVAYPTDGTVSFVAQCMGEGTSTIWDKCIFEIDGNEQFCYGANQPGWNEYSYDVEAGEHTFTWKYSKDSSVNPSGDYMQVDNVQFHYEGGGGGHNPITDVTWSNILPKEMASVAVLTATSTVGSVEGATVSFVNTCEYETAYSFDATFDETGEIIVEDFRKGNYEVSANLDGCISDYLDPVEVSAWGDTLYLTINFTEFFKPVETIVVSNTGYARWTDILPHDADVAERYIVNMNNVNQGETTDCFMQLDVDGLTPGQTYPAKVAVIYSTGMSPWTETTFVYQACDNTYPVIDNITNTGMDVTITWNGGTPPTPPTPPSGEIYDFENSTMQGWTTIDADGDGQTWELGSTVMGTGYGHNGSSDLVLSKSYDNNIGALNPNNFLVSPAKAEYPAISFFACAQDNAWAAEHFGVAVSTTTATASAFTMVQEWTMTAKGQGVPAPGRGGDLRTQGNWYEYTVDLSAYAGQEIWVAIRHFNCTDYFYLDVDDITLGEGGGVPPTPPTPPTGDVYDFETGMQGWTTIDADGDGQSWDLGSTVMGSGYGHNGSSDLVLSKSYDNNIGALNPNNFLVSPAKAAYTGISFFACAQDNAWAAEHFGVAVSTTTATASAFTMIQEWTMTAKGQGVPAPGRGGDLRTQGNWYEYTVDLSAYAGQEIWVAIRHFNCTDYFYLDVDDITLGEGTKRGGNFAAAGMGFGAASNSPTDDGNWYYYDNGTNEDAIGLNGGGSFYWGVMFPAGQYEGSTVTKVSMYDYSAHTGNILIYQGGSSAPGTLLATEAYTNTGSENFIEVTLSSPVTIDPTQNLWIVLNNNDGGYVAACSANTGNANGRWISLDGSDWGDLASYGLSYTWMIRAYIETGGGGGGTGASAITPNKFNILVDGEVVGATSDTYFTWTCPDYDEHLYEVVWVDADYNITCPNGEWYQIPITNVSESMINSVVYPNPTNGDLHINATDMVRINIVNTLGQMVYDQAVKSDETIINMARFDAGIYLVNIITKNGSSVKRVVVTK